MRFWGVLSSILTFPTFILHEQYMKNFFGFLFFYFVFVQSVWACDYLIPDITTSEYISGKTVFWGFATAKKWDRNAKFNPEGDFPTSTYLEVEVLRGLKGKIGKETKIWLSETSCGIDPPLGEVFLFVVRPEGKSEYYADELTSTFASDKAIISLLKLNFDVKALGSSYPPSPDWLSSGTWEKWDKDCQSSDPNLRPNNCLNLSELEQISNAYDEEHEAVEKIFLTEANPWWAEVFK